MSCRALVWRCAGAVPVRLEALRALQAAAEGCHCGIDGRWPALCDAIVANTQPRGSGGQPLASPLKRQPQGQQRHNHRTETGRFWTPQQAHAPLPGGTDRHHGSSVLEGSQSAAAISASSGQDVNEQCALQALRLLAAVLELLSRRVWPSDIGSVRGAQPEADSDSLRTAVGAWEDACARVLPDFVVSVSAPIRAAAVAVATGMTPQVYRRIPAMTRDMLRRWTMASTRDDAPVVRAAAVKAAGALAAAVASRGTDAGRATSHVQSALYAQITTPQRIHACAFPHVCCHRHSGIQGSSTAKGFCALQRGGSWSRRSSGSQRTRRYR